LDAFGVELLSEPYFDYVVPLISETLAKVLKNG